MNAYDTRLLDYLRAYDDGSTAIDLATDTGLRTQSVSTRLAALEKLGYVETIGKRITRATGASGKVRKVKD